MLGLPCAGGKEPEWQLAHWPVTAIWVWFQLEGLKAVVVWQLVQFREPVGMWVADLPLALVALWQLAQLVADVKPAWSMPLAGVKPLVEWQLSQGSVVTTWLAVLPGAVDPLWQT